MIQDTNRTDTREQIRELTADELQMVAGGRKAGGDQQEYYVVKFEQVLVAGV